MALLFVLSAPAAQAGEPLVGQWHFDTVSNAAAQDSTPDSSGGGRDLITCQNCAFSHFPAGGRFDHYLDTASFSVPLPRRAGYNGSG